MLVVVVQGFEFQSRPSITMLRSSSSVLKIRGEGGGLNYSWKTRSSGTIAPFRNNFMFVLNWFVARDYNFVFFCSVFGPLV